MYKLFRYSLFIGMSLISNISLSAQDPMRPPNWMLGNKNVSSSSAERLVLQQILISKNRTLAVINDVVVSVGDTVGGAKVKEISTQWVKVIRGGRNMTLKMAPTTKEYIREK